MSAALSTTRHGAQATAILALTLWGEAAGRPVRVMEGVAAVVMNRLRLAAQPDGSAHLGRGVAGICRAPFQFACWNPNHPGRAAMVELREQGDTAFAACRRIAARTVAGLLPDPTGGATHYHPAETLPRWAVGKVASAELGGLVFYRLLD